MYLVLYDWVRLARGIPAQQGFYRNVAFAKVEGDFAKYCKLVVIAVVTDLVNPSWTTACGVARAIVIDPAFLVFVLSKR